MGKILGNLTNEQVALPGGGAMTAPQAQNTIPSMPDPTSGLDAQPKSTQSTVQKPSFLQAMNTGPGGTANIMSPELSTKGKILTALMSAGFGALAGAGQKTVGEGFQQGSQLPWQQAQQRQQTQSGALDLQQKELQNQYFPQILAQNFRKTNAEIGKNEAEANKYGAEAGAVPAKAALEAAQTEAANYKDDPNLGLIDLRTKQPVNPGGFAPLTADEAQILGKQPGERVPLKVKNTASEIANRGKTTVNTEEGVFDYNRNTGSKKKLGNNPRMVFAPENKIVPAAADPNNPGNVTYMRAGQAMQSGAQAPGSAPVGAAKATLKSATSGDIAKQSTAFQTAMQHADLLEKATTALANGDTRSLNSIKNQFKTQFGSADPTNWQAIANAYTREITAMLSKGHLTDSEISSAGGTLPANASPQQILGVIKTYKALAASKMNILQQQTQKGMQGQANFPEAPPEIHYKIVNGQLVAQ